MDNYATPLILLPSISIRKHARNSETFFPLSQNPLSFHDDVEISAYFCMFLHISEEFCKVLNWGVRMSAEFVLRMGLEAGFALLTLLILLSFGMTDARGEEVRRVSVGAPILTDLGVKYNLRAVQPRLKLRESRGDVEELGVMMAVLQQQALVLDQSMGRKSTRRGMIGSAAPECGYTCGACLPCKLEVVSYDCNEGLEAHAEACPMGYLCTCHGMSFPIP